MTVPASAVFVLGCRSVTVDGKDEDGARVEGARENNPLPVDAEEDELLLLTGGLALLPMLLHRPPGPQR